MKKIRLNTIHYISWKGIVLSSFEPSIEATEENLEKLEPYIAQGKLIVIDEDEDKRLHEENPPKIEKVPEIANNEERTIGIDTVIERVHEFTIEELKSKNKSELIEICEARKIEFKKSMTVQKLEELILNNQ